jgi:hypothetical protein
MGELLRMKVDKLNLPEHKKIDKDINKLTFDHMLHSLHIMFVQTEIKLHIFCTKLYSAN